VDGDSCALDIREDALVGGGSTAFVVLGLKAIDGYDYVELSEALPLGGDDAEGTGDDLGVDAAGLDLRQEEFELSIADQGVAADERDVQGLFFVQESEHTLDELVSLEVGEFAELDASIEVRWVEGVTTRAAQRAFLGNFDGQGRSATDENLGPCAEDF